MSDKPKPQFGMLIQAAILASSARGPERRPSTYTYFIWMENPHYLPGPIKIGCASDPVARLAQLQTASPYPLSLIGYVPGGEKLERELHQKYAHLRLRGEWFDCTVELEQELIDMVLDYEDSIEGELA